MNFALSPEVLLRLGLAFGAGILLGIERESHGRGAGLRTTALVCLAACVAMVISDTFYVTSFQLAGTGAGWHPDPARLAAGVLSGMGFLGAGVVMRQNHVIKGVTTAAVLWFATVIGLAFGTGSYALGLAGLALAMLTLLGLPYVEQYVQNDWYSTLTVAVREPGGASLEAISEVLARHQLKLKSMELAYDLAAGTRKILGQVKYKKGDLVSLPSRLSAELARLPGVLQIEWK